MPTQLDRGDIRDLRERVKMEMRSLQANRNRETM
jgi:hypothetical protein